MKDFLMCLIFLLTYLLTWTIGAAVVSFVHTEYLTVKQLYTDETLCLVMNLVGWLPAVALMLYAERHLDD
jgi:hypothetical protein